MTVCTYTPLSPNSCPSTSWGNKTPRRGKLTLGWFRFGSALALALVGATVGAADFAVIGANCTAGDMGACRQLAEPAKNGQRDAVRHLTAQDMLGEIVATAEDDAIHRLAVERLTLDGLTLLNRRYEGFLDDPYHFIQGTSRVLRLHLEQEIPGASPVLSEPLEELLGSTWTAAPGPAILHVQVQGEALSAIYKTDDWTMIQPYAQRYTGASVSGRACLKWKGAELRCSDFSGEAEPASTLFQAGDDCLACKPENAPFGDAIKNAMPDLIPFFAQLKGPAWTKIVAQDSPNDAVRSAAVVLLNDVALLRRISSNDPNESVREAALARLAAVCVATTETTADQALLAELAEDQANSDELRVIAVERLDDQAAVTGVAVLAAGGASASMVDELIAKNLESRGGLEALRAVQALRMTGKMQMGPGMEAPFTLELKRPGKRRLEFEFQGMTYIQALDGDVGWQVMPFAGPTDPEPMSPEDLKDSQEQADIDGPLVDYAAKGHAVELLGEESVEGADTYKLKVTLKNGDVRYIYLDNKHFLGIKQDGKRMVTGSEVETETSFGDFNEVSGVVFPHTIEAGAKGQPERGKLIIETIEVNAEIDDARFQMPEKAAEAG